MLHGMNCRLRVSPVTSPSTLCIHRLGGLSLRRTQTNPNSKTGAPRSKTRFSNTKTVDYIVIPVIWEFEDVNWPVVSQLLGTPLRRSGHAKNTPVDSDDGWRVRDKPPSAQEFGTFLFWMELESKGGAGVACVLVLQWGLLLAKGRESIDGPIIPGRSKRAGEKSCLRFQFIVKYCEHIKGQWSSL